MYIVCSEETCRWRIPDAQASRRRKRVVDAAHNGLGLSHAIVISVAVMSPAASIFFNTIPQAGLVGAAIPLCYVVGFLVALLVANQYSEFSRELPSSGSAYTFVPEGLGPRWGFLTGWIGLASLALGVPYSFVLMSANLQTLISRWAGVDIPWPAYFVAGGWRRLRALLLGHPRVIAHGHDIAGLRDRRLCGAGGHHPLSCRHDQRITALALYPVRLCHRAAT